MDVNKSAARPSVAEQDQGADLEELAADSSSEPQRARPWTFVPGLYVMQGMAYWVVQAASNTFLAAMGLSPSLVGKWSSDLTLPWMLKPLWSPVVDLFGTKRRWLVAMSFAVVGAMLLMAFATGQANYLEWTIAGCLLLAFASATYDIACDGYYMLALGKRDQEAFVGVRNACFRLGKIIVTGGIVGISGHLQREWGYERGEAWGVAFAIGAAVYGAGAIAVALFAPRPPADVAVRALGERAPLGAMLSEYTQRPRFAAILAFILLYRFAESLLTPMISPFLIGKRSDGGLGLDEAQIALSYGTIGVIALLVGGLSGGWCVSKLGLSRMLWPMALVMHMPNLLFAWAAHTQPGAAGATVVVGVEQLGYGFGFSAYMVFVLQLARSSRFATTHYAISTGIMGLSAWLAGRWSGRLVESMGFENFFWLVTLLGIPGLLTLLFIPRLEK